MIRDNYRLRRMTSFATRSAVIAALSLLPLLTIHVTESPAGMPAVHMGPAVAEAHLPQITCTWNNDGQEVDHSEGTYRCTCTVPNGCYWYLLGPDPAVKIDKYTLRMVVGVPDDEDAAAISEVLFEVTVPSNAKVKLRPIPQGPFPERVVVHYTDDVRADGDSLVITVTVTILADREFNAIINAAMGDARLVTVAASETPITFSLVPTENH